MNENIKQIYKNVTGKSWSYDFDGDMAEEFALAIIDECLEICENSCIFFDIDEWRESTKKEMTALTAKALADKIKEHFGVEYD
jgi:hypothetical protein